MKIYKVYCLYQSGDIFSEGYFAATCATKDRAETYILEEKLLDKGYEDVYIEEEEVLE